MDEARLGQRVRQLVVEWAPGPVRTADASARLAEDLGYDSLALMELAVVLDHELGVDAPSRVQASSVVTVADVERLVLGIVTAGEVGR